MGPTPAALRGSPAGSADAGGGWVGYRVAASGPPQRRYQQMPRKQTGPVHFGAVLFGAGMLKSGACIRCV